MNRMRPVEDRLREFAHSRINANSQPVTLIKVELALKIKTEVCVGGR